MRRLLPLLGALAGLTGPVTALQALTVPTISSQAVAAITAQPQVPAAGAQRPDVVIVEYLDYNCPYCRKSAPQLRKFLHLDPRVQILYKEWPIFGGVSVYAARSALAANWQGKFLVAHDALIGTTHDLDQDSDVDAVLRSAGLDLQRLESDRKAHASEIEALLTRSVHNCLR